MAKRNKVITIIPLILLVILIIFANKNKHMSAVDNINDTVPAGFFELNGKPNKVQIDLHTITKVAFPKYKVTKESLFVPDSVSMSADEETIGNGNYSALLTLDTIPSKDLYTRIAAAAAKDTCWKIKNNAINYTKIDRQGGTYKISFIKDSKQIVVTHTNK